MKPTQEQIIDILKNNSDISQLYDYFSDNEITYDFVDENNIDIRIERDDWESVLFLKIDTDFYDEKFVDVNKYEVEDMGVKFLIWTGGDENEELTMVNIWRHLFFEKEPITSKK